MDGISLQMMNQFGELDPNTYESFSNTDYLVENFLGYHYEQPENPLGLSHFLPDSPQQVIHIVDLTRDTCQESKKRKVRELSESSSEDSLAMENKRINKRKQEKEVDVVHVRARRGQATDTHSLTERVRREKIKNKLRRLQDLVPGCQKRMGLIMTLDEIISYVHSLQNQIEFLSTELAAAACSSNQLN
ncbi:hypothetical protein UlMin_014259 [Ulmus minor]